MITVSKKSLIFVGLVFSNILFAEEVCVLDSSQSYGYTGDVSGKRVYTTEDFYFKCTDTVTKQGTCKKWDITKETYDLSSLKTGTVVYETEDFSGSMGAALGIVQSYDKINGLWSGWHGLCQKGKDDGNWDWLSDPYVLANYAISAYAGTYGSEVNSAASTANKSADFAADTAMDASMDNASWMHQTASNTQQAAEAASYAAKVSNYAVCAARSGIDVSKTIEEYVDDGEACDPIDEFCDELAGEIDSEIFTLPENQLNDLINTNPDYSKYIKVISGTGTGVVTVKIINPGTVAHEADMQKAKELAAQMKEEMLKIRAAVMTASLAGCIATSSTSVSGGGSQNSDMFSAQNIAVTAIGAWNPLVGIAVDMAFNTFASLKDINTCQNKDDAEKKGTRHLATLNATQHNMCHFIEKIESGNSFSMNEKTKFRYCCYDDKLTRIMIEQAKAQLAKDWQHCTDVTLAELQYLSFNACTPEDRSYGIDGVQLDAYASLSERFNAYQFKRKCIDIEEYISYMKETFGGEDMLVDDTLIKEQLESLKD